MKVSLPGRRAVDRYRPATRKPYPFRDQDIGKQVSDWHYNIKDNILSHKAFADTLQEYFENGRMPAMGAIVRIMKQSNLYNVGSDSTLERRSSTIKGWLNWSVGLINELN